MSAYLMLPLTPTTARLRLPWNRLKRGGMMAVVAICKAALLMAMLQSSGNSLVSNSELVEQKVETLCTSVGQLAPSRSTAAQKLAVRSLHRTNGGASQVADQRRPGSCPLGHFLSSGNRAPLQC